MRDNFLVKKTKESWREIRPGWTVDSLITVLCLFPSASLTVCQWGRIGSTISRSTLIKVLRVLIVTLRLNYSWSQNVSPADNLLQDRISEVLRETAGGGAWQLCPGGQGGHHQQGRPGERVLQLQGRHLSYR